MSDNNYMNKPHIYKITNNINQKFYYGVHNGSKTDTYMGSGKALKRAQKKYGLENFSKEILLWFDTLEEAYEYEAVIVTEKLINDPMCYNLKCGGFGGTTPSEETRQKMSEKAKCRKYSKEERKKISEATKGENNGMYGKTHSNEARKKMSEKAKINNVGENNPMYGKTHSNETRQKMSKRKENMSEQAHQNYRDGWKKREIVECPYCYKKSNNLGSMNRWHFNNCKLNQNKE